jgi:hypothetical protein
MGKDGGRLFQKAVLVVGHLSVLVDVEPALRGGCSVELESFSAQAELSAAPRLSRHRVSAAPTQPPLSQASESALPIPQAGSFLATLAAKLAVTGRAALAKVGAGWAVLQPRYHGPGVPPTLVIDTLAEDPRGKTYAPAVPAEAVAAIHAAWLPDLPASAGGDRVDTDTISSLAEALPATARDLVALCRREVARARAYGDEQSLAVIKDLLLRFEDRARAREDELAVSAAAAGMTIGLRKRKALGPGSSPSAILAALLEEFAFKERT